MFQSQIVVYNIRGLVLQGFCLMVTQPKSFDSDLPLFTYQNHGDIWVSAHFGGVLVLTHVDVNRSGYLTWTQNLGEMLLIKNICNFFN